MGVQAQTQGAQAQGQGGQSEQSAQKAQWAAAAASASASALHKAQENAAQAERSQAHLAGLYSKQGKEQYSTGHYQRSLDSYNKCLKTAPPAWIERATALGNRAAVLVMLHRYVEAVDDCETALRQCPHMAKLHVRRGRALLRLGQFDAAEEAFSRVLGLQALDLLAPLERTDADLFIAAQEGLEGNKTNARLGVRDLGRLRQSARVLVGAEGQGKWKEVLRVAEEVLALAPHYRPAQVSKASALGESSPDDCKAYVEHLVCSTHHSIHALHNPHSDLSPLPAAALEWRAVPSLAPPQGPIRADLASTLKLLLRAGPELSLVYVTALKNITLNRIYSADVMGKLSSLLNDLAVRVGLGADREGQGALPAEPEGQRRREVQSQELPRRAAGILQRSKGGPLSPQVDRHHLQQQSSHPHEPGHAHRRSGRLS